MEKWFNGATLAYCWAAIVAIGTLEIIVPAVLQAIEVMHLAVNPLG